MKAIEDAASWRKKITIALHAMNETWDDIVACTLSKDELDVEFDDSYGTSEGRPFTAWTTSRVYFPVVYDGAEWVESVPRNPCDEKTEHVGGQ